MDVLWSPWRYSYIKSDKESGTACIFCDLLNDPASDEEKYILHRAGHNFVILNIYPYIGGHLMIVPYQHLENVSAAGKDETDELMDLTKKTEEILREVYEPQGINIGMNLGKAAGAGVANHFHMHVLPRWIGDANFMTAIGETRTVPESLQTTYEKLAGRF
ncbi:MAG: HIT domain-containing protein [Pyrinomonadaceae bacterium]|nr:HIT domain-containing protein [Pyrinomonadaceae bacterium]